MKKNISLAAAIAACICPSAFGATDRYLEDEGFARFVDATNPYASIGYGYDSNIFRYDDEVRVEGGQSDQFLMANAGFDAEILVGQQRHELSGVISRTAFDTHDELDYTGAKATAIWHWSAAGAYTGTLGYKYRRTPRDFANQFSLDKEQDIRTEHQFLGSADIDLPGHWIIGGRAEASDISFSESEALDLQRTTLGATGTYVSAAGNEIGLDAEYVDGEYQEDRLGDFEEYTVGPFLEWKLTERTQLQARVGYTARDNLDSASEDYDGMTGRLALDFTDSGRSKFTASIYRDLSNLGDEIAEYAVVDGVRLEPSWQFANGLDLRLVGGYEKRDFKAQLPGEAREDDVVIAGAFAEWGISRHFRVSLGIDTERRSSTRELQDYDFNRIQLQLIGQL